MNIKLQLRGFSIWMKPRIQSCSVLRGSQHKKGKHKVGAITSCERGQNVTGVYVVRACGFYVPPMLIYTRKRRKDSLSYGAPPGSCPLSQDKGWMDSEVF
jgi:hypothetical protein